MTDGRYPAPSPRGSTAAEDYVKVIYAHTEWQDEPMMPSQLATRLGLAASTVTEMVKKLAVSGLVRHRPYGAIELTPDGRLLALRLLRRHRLIETWLVSQLGYGWDEVHDEADVLEHAMSDRLVEALAASLGHPVRDPHGDAIPTADGAMPAHDARALLELQAGESGTVTRISDSDPELLRYLASNGIDLDVVVTVAERGKYSGTLLVRTPEADVHLSPEAAGAVWVRGD